MQKLVAYLKTTIVGGLLVILPLYLLFLLVSELVEQLMGLLSPFAALLPKGYESGPVVKAILAVIVFLVLCFLAGMLIKTSRGGRIWNAAEDKLKHIPGYRLIQALFRSFAGNEVSDFKPVMVKTAVDTEVLAFIVDEEPGGSVTILIPIAPTPFVGELHFVAEEKVRRLDISMKDAVTCITEWGIGGARHFKK